MARLVTYGAETGLIEEAGSNYGSSTPTGPVTDAGRMRTGAYSLRIYNLSNDSGRQWSLGASPAEIYFAVNINNSAASYTNTFLQFLESGTQHICFKVAATTGILSVLRGSTTIVTTSYAIPLNTNVWLKGHIIISDDTGVGRVELWANGQKVVDFTGDTMNGGSGVINTVAFATGLGGSIYFDDLKVNDTTGSAENGMPGDGGILLLKPTGPGTSTQLLASPTGTANWAAVDEVPGSSTDYIASSTLDTKDTFAMEDVPASYTLVRLVQPLTYAAMAVAGSGNVTNIIRSGGTDYGDATGTSCSTTYNIKRGDIRYTDPADSAGWTPAKVNALEIGVQVK